MQFLILNCLGDAVQVAHEKGLSRARNKRGNLLRRPTGTSGHVGLDMQIVTAIEALDIAAFIVESQTSEYDKISFLRIQNMIRAHVANYVYVEVGSHLGGTLAPHLADPRCR